MVFAPKWRNTHRLLSSLWPLAPLAAFLAYHFIVTKMHGQYVASFAEPVFSSANSLHFSGPTLQGKQNIYIRR
jgi:hypothetical protein